MVAHLEAPFNAQCITPMKKSLSKSWRFSRGTRGFSPMKTESGRLLCRKMIGTRPETEYKENFVTSRRLCSKHRNIFQVITSFISIRSFLILLPRSALAQNIRNCAENVIALSPPQRLLKNMKFEGIEIALEVARARGREVSDCLHTRYLLAQFQFLRIL